MSRISAIQAEIASQLSFSVPSSCRRILRNPSFALNLRRIRADISKGRDIENRFRLGVPDMPKAARISAPVTASAASSEKSESSAFASIALFSAIGLLVSLVAILLGVPGEWY